MDKLMSLSNARAHLPKIVSKVNKNLERITITVNGKPKAAIISYDELESLEETAEILSLPGAKKSILEGLRQAKSKRGVNFNKLNS